MMITAGLVSRGVGATILVFSFIACAGLDPAWAATAATPETRTADAPHSQGGARTGASRAPSSPPLVSAVAEAGAGTEEGISAPAASSAGDPLISNGLGSPMCRAGADEADLSRTSQSNCRTSGFEAAPAPTGNYAFDVHIDTGVTKLTNDADATVQNMLQLAWTVLVAAVHGLIVMIEWCYTIDLIDSAAMSGVAKALRETQTAFTQPWLVVVLAVASVLASYQGLVRRRVAETVGQALLMLAMMVGGLWVIMDPTGTIGSLGQWANEAGLGALGAVAGGSPERPERTLADSMGGLFSSAIDGPWCYMEFGNVGWCTDPARIDPRLRASGRAIAARERAQIDCSNAQPLQGCVRPASDQVRALSESATELLEANTNGGLFLALPANQAMRNSINDSGSLFNVLCGGSETPCRGPTAPEAEFRTQHGTEWRFMGLVFIWAGALGMLLLLGFIAVHLLGAAIASLLYLLLAPAAVLAPALGDGGRAAFRGWATRLLGAVMSKLIYSFLLGVVLLMGHILTVDLAVLGWLTQWLLISTMWWGAFCQRHRVLDLAQGRYGQTHESRSLARRVSGALETPMTVLRGAALAKRKLSKGAPTVEGQQPRTDAARERARAGVEDQVSRTLGMDHREAAARAHATPKIQKRLSAGRAQLERVRSERGKALESGDARRAAELGHRAQRIEAEIGDSQQGLNEARVLAGDGERLRQATGRVYTREQAAERQRFLDAQAALPASARIRGSGGAERRDYAALASLAGYAGDEYERLAPKDQRAARLQVDRELALRKELKATAGELAASGPTSSLGRREQQRLNGEFDRTLQQRLRDGGHEMPSSRIERSGLESWQQGGRADRERAKVRGSSVMRDAHEVAARRKRQLGQDRR